MERRVVLCQINLREEVIMSELFFSVITPNYNSGLMLLRAARSLSRNKINFEHIIIDDCSSDVSFDLPAEFEHNTSILRNKKNIGPGPSRNRGLQVAKGKYVIFMDSDDVFVPGALDYMHRVLISKGLPDVLIFGYRLVRDDLYKFMGGEFYASCSEVELIGKSALLNRYFLDEIVSAPWGKCISSGLAKSASFPPLRVSQDSFYNLDVFMRVGSAAIVKDEIYIFDKSDAKSLTSKAFDFSEFKSFYRSWLAFEKKVLDDPNLVAYNNLLYARKIKFCVLYYMSRLALTPEDRIDARVVRIVRMLFLRSFWLARENVSIKAIVAAFSFCIFPKLTIRVLRLVLLRKNK